MNISTAEWNELYQLPLNEAKKRIFSILQHASASIQREGTEDPGTLECVPRLADLISKRPELADFGIALSSLARSTGLWNYINKEDAATADLVLAESVSVPELDGIILHREQVAALNDLLAGRNLILSAPTSFGKSLLIDALLASKRYKRIAIILPTIALLDEFRRRLTRRFRNEFDLVIHPSEKATDGKAVIFLGTQERLINRPDLGALDLTVVDEFYKLDPSRKDERSITLNAAVSKLLNKSRQFFFLGPNIDDVRFSNSARWKFEFIRTRFSTVAVDVYDMSTAEDKEGHLVDQLVRKENWPALVFVSSPDKANKLGTNFSEKFTLSDQGQAFSEWLSENIGHGSPLVQASRSGIGIHHGRIPRAIAAHMVRMFNEMKLPALLCTSTLIEGVNTAAKTVLIYDKAINREPYDFFTFANIRGRAGRLGEHHVGQVFLFNAPPDADFTEVAPTLFGDQDEAPDDYVVYLDNSEITRSTNSRVAGLREALELDEDGLRVAASIGLENALTLKSAVRQHISSTSKLFWAGIPKYEEISSVFEVICQVRKPTEFGALTVKQLTYLVHTLRLTHRMRDFLLNHDQGYRGKPEGHDSIFKFLRSCEYGLPQHLAVVELFVKQYANGIDYSLFIQSLSRWFRPEVLKNLDEEGVPIQISERFYDGESDKAALAEKLLSAARNRSNKLSRFEADWLVSSLE